MTVMFYVANEGEATTHSSTSWVEVASVSGVACEGEYKVFYNCEYAGALVDEPVAARVLIDGVEMSFDAFNPFMENIYRTFGSFVMAVLGEGSHTVSLEARCLSATQSVKVRRKRLLVEKH